MKEMSIRIALLLGGLLFSLLVAEMLVRFLGLAPEVALIQRGRFQLSKNVKIGYEPAPLDYQGTDLRFFDYRGASNRLGYRDYDHTDEKPPGRYRILILGDSIGAGLLIDRYEDTFPAIIESRLKALGLDVEVINLSVSGYNTQQEVETLKEKGLIYDPDLVLLAYCLNDRTLDDGYILGTLLEQQLETEGIPSARTIPFVRHSALFRLIRYRIFKPQRPKVPEDLAEYYQAVATDTVDASLEELASLGREHDFEVLVALVPAFQELQQYPMHGEHERVQEIVVATGMDFLDLLDPLSSCAGDTREPIAYDIYHPTAQGHACIGESLAEYILSKIPYP